MDTSGRKVENVSKKTKGKGKAFLPDDIITNILSRLPAKNVMRCRIVCKGWRDLTLDRDFVDLHFRRHSNIPMIIVANRMRNNRTVDYFLLDKWWELHARKNFMIHKFQVDSGNIPPYHCHALFSHAGLVVFRNYDSDGKDAIVCNPMDPENVRVITLCKEICLCQIYGVFFHPLLKEYCSLWMIQKGLGSSCHPEWIKYKMLTLGSNPSMKTIINPFSHRVMRLCSSPLFIDKYLYWMLKPENVEQKYSGHNDIMQFDIIGEEFTVLRCPVPLDDMKFSYINIYLLNIDGTLSFLLILPRKITICRLEDHAQQLWTTADYPFSLELFSVELYQRSGVPKAIAVVEGKLALLSNNRLENAPGF